MLFLIFKVNAQSPVFTPNIKLQKYQSVNTDNPFKYNQRKNADHSISSDNNGNLYIGGNRYTMQYLKMRSYDLDIYDPEYKLQKSMVFVYPQFDFIKNLKNVSILNSTSGTFNDQMIIGGGQLKESEATKIQITPNPVSRPYRGTILSKTDLRANLVNYNFLNFVYNGESIRTGGVSHIPILNDASRPTGFYIGIIKNFDITPGGCILAIYDDAFNVVKTSYFSYPQKELSYNDIVQIGFPKLRSINPNTFVDDLQNAGVLFALDGTIGERGQSYTDSKNNNLFKEIVSIVTPDFNSISSVVNNSANASKGADIVYDSKSSIIYTLGNSSQTYYVSGFKFRGNQLSLFKSSVFTDKSVFAETHYVNNTPTITWGTGPKNKNLQANGVSLLLNNNELTIAGHIESAFSWYPSNSNILMVNDRLSHIAFTTSITTNLTPIRKKRYNNYFAIRQNGVQGRDFIYYDNPSSKTLMGEFTPNLLTLSNGKVINLYSSDYFPSELKHSLTDYTAASKCDNIDTPITASNGYSFEDDFMVTSDPNLTVESFKYSYPIEETTKTEQYCTDPLFGVGLEPKCASPCMGCTGFTVIASPLASRKNGTRFENFSNYTVSNTACASTGCFEIVPENVKSYNITINPLFTSQYALSNLGGGKYRICRYDNTIPLGTLSNLFTISGVVPTNAQKITRMNVSHVFYNTRCTQTIPLENDFLKTTSTYTSNVANASCASANFKAPNISLVPGSAFWLGCGKLQVQLKITNNTNFQLNCKYSYLSFAYRTIHGTQAIANSMVQVNGSNSLYLSGASNPIGGFQIFTLILDNGWSYSLFDNSVDIIVNWKPTSPTAPYCNNMFHNTVRIPILNLNNNGSNPCCITASPGNGTGQILPSDCGGCPSPCVAGDICGCGYVCTQTGLPNLTLGTNNGPVQLPGSSTDPTVSVSLSDPSWSPIVVSTSGASDAHNTNDQGGGAGGGSGSGAGGGSGDYDPNNDKMAKANDNKPNFRSYVYPNPTMAGFRIEPTGLSIVDDNSYTVIIRNMEGKIVSRESVTGKNLKTTSFNTQSLSNGRYYISLMEGDNNLFNNGLEIKK